jgi:hypothetical protein
MEKLYCPVWLNLVAVKADIFTYLPVDLFPFPAL